MECDIPLSSLPHEYIGECDNQRVVRIQPRAIACVVILLCAAVCLHANKGIHCPTDSVSMAVVDDIIRCNFDRAQRRIDTIHSQHEDTLTASFLRVFLIGLRDLDYSLEIKRPPMERAFEKTMELLDSSDTGEDPMGASCIDMTRGMAQAAISSYYLRTGNYLKGIGNGRKAVNSLNEAVAQHPSNVDASFFLGLYSYARGELRKRLWWVLFWFPGNKKKGIATLQQCAHQGTITRTAARIALVHIYAMEQWFSRAHTVHSRLRERYPHSRFVKWAYAQLCTEQRRFEEAAQTYTALARTYEKIPSARKSRIAAAFMAARSYCDAGMREETMQYGTRVLNLCENHKGSFFDEKLQQTKELLEKCTQLPRQP